MTKQNLEETIVILTHKVNELEEKCSVMSDENKSLRESFAKSKDFIMNEVAKIGSRSSGS